MNRIEEEVHAHFAEASSRPYNDPAPNTSAIPSTTASSSTDSEIAFANVNSVIPGSPADSAGMEAGDHVIRFGTVNWMNHDKLSKVAEVVMQNEGVSSHQLSWYQPVLELTTKSAADSSDRETGRRIGKFGDQELYTHTTSKLGR
jgi:predicted metalloprotease with PDZ domain